MPLVSYAEYDAAPAVFPESWSYLFDAEEGNRTEYRKGENGGYVYMNLEQMDSLFKEELNAVTVGEPTGQFTSLFYYKPNMKIVLPLSQLSVSVATNWYEGSDFAGAAYDENGRLYEWENTILPDVYIHQDIEDIRQGKNSALKWILAQ